MSAATITVTVRQDGILTRKGARELRAVGVKAEGQVTNLTTAKARAKRAGVAVAFVSATNPEVAAKMPPKVKADV